MNKKIFLKIVLTCIYILGIICVVRYSFLYLSHSKTILNPNAMIPMMSYEKGAWSLMLGLPFMIIYCLSIIIIYKVRKMNYKILIFLPSIVDIIIVMIYWISELSY
jgi:hypothetical protein